LPEPEKRTCSIVAYASPPSFVGKASAHIPMYLQSNARICARTTRRSAAHGYRYSTKRRLLPFAFLLWSKSKQLKPNTQNNIGKVWAAARCICEGRVGVRSFLCSFCGFFLRCLFECVNYSMVTTSSGPWVVRFFTRKQAPFAWWEVGHSTAVRTIVRSCAAIDQCQRRPATRERPTDRLAD
jgi:hypothetical protein